MDIWEKILMTSFCVIVSEIECESNNDKNLDMSYFSDITLYLNNSGERSHGL